MYKIDEMMIIIKTMTRKVAEGISGTKVKVARDISENSSSS